jgi:four helix bundle protein
MATITCSEDLEIWQLAREMCKNVNNLIQENRFKNDFSLTDQIRRSSGSAMDNIAEGFERNGNKEFINFLSYSKASAGECRSQLYRALDYNYINENEFNHLKEKSIELGVKIKKFMDYLRKSEYRGSKFK